MAFELKLLQATCRQLFYVARSPPLVPKLEFQVARILATAEEVVSFWFQLLLLVLGKRQAVKEVLVWLSPNTNQALKDCTSTVLPMSNVFWLPDLSDLLVW
jgi:hypothetical protein